LLPAGLKVIKKKLVRKAIDMIKKLADAEVKAAKKGEEEKEEGECRRAGKAARQGGSQAGGQGGDGGGRMGAWGQGREAALTRGAHSGSRGGGQALRLLVGSRGWGCEQALGITHKAPKLASPRHAAPAAEAAAAEQSEEGKKKAEEAAGAFAKFYASFGKSLKMGIIEDSSNR
jgi:hypothetical protein